MTNWPTRSAWRVPKLGGHEVRPCDSDHRQVGIWIITHQVGLKPTAVGQCHFDLAGIMHDMTIGQDEAVRREEEPRASSLATLGKSADQASAHFSPTCALQY